MDLMLGILLLGGLTSTYGFLQSEDSGCPPDWMHVSTKDCFKFLPSKTNMSWFDAQYECEKAGGYLAEPKTLDQMEILVEISSFYDINLWWIGLSDLGHEGIWSWQHSVEIVSNGFWDSGCPSNQSDNRLDCAYLSGDHYAWKDGDCRNSLVGHALIAPICQKETFPQNTTTTYSPQNITRTTYFPHTNTTTRFPHHNTTTSRTTPFPHNTTTTYSPQNTTRTTYYPHSNTTTHRKTNTTTASYPETTTADGCPFAWSEFDGSCFYLIPESLTWLEARETCHNFGADLASIHSEEQNNFISDLVRGFDSVNSRDKYYWLGGTDSHSEGSWEWSNGSPWDYQNWDDKNGNGGVVCNCLSYYNHCPSNDYYNCHHDDYYWDQDWTDLECSFSLLSVCQIN